MTDGENGIKYPFAWNLINGLEMYYLPALVVLGSLGNCLSVYVVFASKMRRTSSSFYLAALALSDTGFLMSLFIAWLGVVNVNLINKQGFCQFFVYLTNVCSFLSAWFVVAFTIERFVAVCYPLRRQWMCTVNRAKILIGAVTAGGLILCSPVLLYTRPRLTDNSTKEICLIVEGWDKVASALNFLDTILTFALPFSIIVVLNSLIVRAVWHVDSIRSSLKARNSTKDSPPAVHQAKVTKMLLVVSSVFFCLNLPAYAMRVYAYLQVESTATDLEVLTQKACNLLFHTNFGISFGLYCASGQNFRLAVVQLFNCRRQRQLRIGQSKLSSTNQTNQHGNIAPYRDDKNKRLGVRRSHYSLREAVEGFISAEAVFPTPSRRRGDRRLLRQPRLPPEERLRRANVTKADRACGLGAAMTRELSVRKVHGWENVDAGIEKLRSAGSAGEEREKRKINFTKGCPIRCIKLMLRMLRSTLNGAFLRHSTLCDEIVASCRWIIR